MVLGKKNPSTDNFKYPHSETLGLVLVVSDTTFWKSKSSFHFFAELQKKSGTKSMQEENVVSQFLHCNANISSIFCWSFRKSEEQNQCLWLFMKFQQKNWKKSLMEIQCPDCVTTFFSYKDQRYKCHLSISLPIYSCYMDILNNAIL